MPHAPGWVALYEDLDRNQVPDPALILLCKQGKSGLGESMLHWYAIEGSTKVVKALIDLGFDVNPQNEFGNTPLMEVATMGRWDMAQLLLLHGARTDIINKVGNDFNGHVEDYQIKCPKNIRRLTSR